MQSHKRFDGIIGDVCDSELFQKYPSFQQHENALQLLVYFDEIEVCNPLAGHAGVHKLSMINAINFITYIHLQVCCITH